MENTNCLLYLSHDPGLWCRILEVLSSAKAFCRHLISRLEKQDVQGRPCGLKFCSADALPVDVGIIAFA